LELVWGLTAVVTLLRLNRVEMWRVGCEFFYFRHANLH